MDVWGAVEDGEFGKAKFALRLYKGAEFVRSIRLEPDVTYIGRMPENHVVLDDPKASRSHARIIARGDKFFVEDQQSGNGVYVNGKKISNHTLTVGDRIKIGEHELEFVPATDEAAAVREAQMEHAEEEEWRMDQTLNSASDAAQKLYAAGLSPDSAAARGDKVSQPTLSMTFTFGDQTFQKTVVFEKGKKRTDGKTAMEIDITVQFDSWVLKKKVNL